MCERAGAETTDATLKIPPKHLQALKCRGAVARVERSETRGSSRHLDEIDLLVIRSMPWSCYLRYERKGIFALIFAQRAPGFAALYPGYVKISPEISMHGSAAVRASLRTPGCML